MTMFDQTICLAIIQLETAQSLIVGGDMSDRILIKANRLWDGINPEILNDAFLLVENGLITALGWQEDRGNQIDQADTKCNSIDLIER
jgi:hypothetical protein